MPDQKGLERVRRARIAGHSLTLRTRVRIPAMASASMHVKGGTGQAGAVRARAGAGVRAWACDSSSSSSSNSSRGGRGEGGGGCRQQPWLQPCNLVWAHKWGWLATGAALAVAVQRRWKRAAVSLPYPQIHFTGAFGQAAIPKFSVEALKKVPSLGPSPNTLYH